MHISEFANQLWCPHCGKTHGTKEWPVGGDIVPFCFEKEPGNYSLRLTCPYCGRDWYVVWDEDPGPTRPLLF